MGDKGERYKTCYVTMILLNHISEYILIQISNNKMSYFNSFNITFTVCIDRLRINNDQIFIWP